MKHRDRVLMALNHQVPDRCPMQISFAPEFASRLKADMNMGGGTLHNPHGGGNTYELERALDEDLLLTSVGWANSYYQEADGYIDEWSIGWRSAEYATPYGVGHYTEMVHHPLADDMGAQHSMIISPKMWRKFLKPRLANFIAELKAINPEVKVAYHSDGNIYPIIPDLIEIGLDVLNPIQPASMDPIKLKQDYGDKLCFWGSMDEQRTLPFGSVADVQADVQTRLITLGNKGGLILAQPITFNWIRRWKIPGRWSTRSRRRLTPNPNPDERFSN